MIEVVTARGAHRLDVRRDGPWWVVTVNGRTRRLDVRRNGALWSLLDAGDQPAGSRVQWSRSHEVAVDPHRNGEIRVHVDGRPIVVRVPWLASGGRRRQTGAAQGGGAHHVVAPMPGRVVKVLVRAGDRVAERQGLVVIEAMKMQNELRAPRAGVIGDVQAAEGALVDAGARLLVIAPELPPEDGR